MPTIINSSPTSPAAEATTGEPSCGATRDWLKDTEFGPNRLVSVCEKPLGHTMRGWHQSAGKDDQGTVRWNTDDRVTS